jgi:hypothetical protein
MISDLQIPEPFLFNPLKHHLGYIKNYINGRTEKPASDILCLTRELKHLGTSVMDVYAGRMPVSEICREIENYLETRKLITDISYSEWTGIRKECCRIISLKDGSQWTLKFQNNRNRYVHFFPARNSRHCFRVKSNTLKSAMIYYILVGKDYITGDDLNKVRPLIGLSPVKDSFDAEAIMEMIEILRS